MTIQNPGDGETVRFQTPGVFVQGIDGSGNPQSLADAVAAGSGGTAIGTTTDAPVADNTTVASATAATGISLWKRLVNLGIAILAKQPALGTAGTASSNVLSVQGIASGTVIPVIESANTSTTVATTAQGTKAVTSAGTPERMVASTTKVESVVIQALKGVATANTGNIYVGFSASGGSNLMVLTPGQSVTFQAPAGKKVDLTNIYIDSATSADAVQYTSIA